MRFLFVKLAAAQAWNANIAKSGLQQTPHRTGRQKLWKTAKLQTAVIAEFVATAI